MTVPVEGGKLESAEPGGPPGDLDNPGDPVSSAGGGPRDQRRLETVAAVLMSAAAVLTAWSAFQNVKWSGVQATNFSQASATRSESVRASTAAGQRAQVDVSLFTAWLTATDQGQTSLAGLLEERFPPELKVAFDAWRATDPLTTPNAAPTPFALPSYQVPGVERANQLVTLAETQFRHATTANDDADNYVLLAVVLAIALFFGGISLRCVSRRLEVMLLCVGWTIMLVVAGLLVVLPIEP